MELINPSIYREVVSTRQHMTSPRDHKAQPARSVEFIHQQVQDVEVTYTWTCLRPNNIFIHLGDTCVFVWTNWINVTHFHLQNCHRDPKFIEHGQVGMIWPLSPKWGLFLLGATLHPCQLSLPNCYESCATCHWVEVIYSRRVIGGDKWFWVLIFYDARTTLSNTTKK